MINIVKLSGEGYLLNGNMSVPKTDGNSDYEAIKLWLAEGNIPTPEFTQVEIDKQASAARIAELTRLLSDSDFKTLPDYDKDNSLAIADRQAWRDEIRQLKLV
jgi:hypothetical protein